jgi:hypothetical protein
MSESITLTASKLYSSWPTAKFRWCARPNPHATLVEISTLQQWWQTSNGDGFWEDIEVVRETKEE